MSQVASTTFAQVQQELYDSGFNYLQDNSQTARAKRWINQSYLELCGQELWPFLKTSTIGTAPVSLPTLNTILFVRDRSLNNKLVESDIDTLTDISPDLTQTGTASWYYLDYSVGAPVVNVYPVTTNSLEIAYFQNPASLSGDSDVLLVPDQFIDLVVLGAMRRAYIDGTDTANQYNLVKAEMSDRLQFMRSQILPRYTYQATEVSPLSSTDW